MTNTQTLHGTGIYTLHTCGGARGVNGAPYVAAPKGQDARSHRSRKDPHHVTQSDSRFLPCMARCSDNGSSTSRWFSTCDVMCSSYGGRVGPTL